MSVVTPAQIESRLVQLGKELDEAHDALTAAEFEYYEAKTRFEIGMAEARLLIGQQAVEGGWKVTVQERDDQALRRNAAAFQRMNTADASVRAMRANVSRLKTQIDIARSVGTSVRAALDLA